MGDYCRRDLIITSECVITITIARDFELRTSELAENDFNWMRTGRIGIIGAQGEIDRRESLGGERVFSVARGTVQ